MKIVVIGGTGLTGAKLVRNLRGLGHAAVPAARSTGVDAMTGAGLAQALNGAQVVIDASAPASNGDAMAFFETSSRNLLAAGLAAGVRHHVVFSVVGTERLLDSGYFRAKLAQEQLARNSGVPFTIVRATQFFEFVGDIVNSATVGRTVRLPPALSQPILCDEVAAMLADIAVGAPMNGMIELAGPEPIPLDDLARRLLRGAPDGPDVVTDSNARYFGAVLDERTLTPSPGARIGSTRFDQWLGRGASSRPGTS